MKVGQYVRCPIYLEEMDKEYPRSFILAQITSINLVSMELTVCAHDLKGSKAFFPHAFIRKVFAFREVEHCPAAREAVIATPDGLGRVLSVTRLDDTEDYYQYFVQLKSGAIRKYLESEVQLEYTSLDYSPLQQMIGYEFQNPSWFGRRIMVSKNMHRASNTIYGFKALLGSRAFLMAHQISSVVRMFESRPIRFMLADEVGLGKTIEACSVVKILTTEKKNLRVLYVVPAALSHQWKNELWYKFGIQANEDVTATERANHLITPLEKLKSDSLVMNQRWDVLIVDETHRALNQEKAYQLLLSLSQQIENVLLLSATPIQNREKEYLRLLTLLQPEQYMRMSPDRFSEILKKQKKIQKRVNVLISHMNQYQDYKEDSKDKLVELSEDLSDKNLIRMVETIHLDAADGGRETMEAAISYISENYRIERNIIRNRREYILETLGQRKQCIIPYEMRNLEDGYCENNVYHAVIETLTRLMEEKRLSTAQMIACLQAMFSSPWALHHTLENSNVDDFELLSLVELWEKQAEEEIKSADYLLDEDPFSIHGRLMHVMDYIEQEIPTDTDECGKIAVFSEFPETLWKFGELLESRGHHCVLFTSNMLQEELEDSVYEFQNNIKCRVILCDASGGEGRNFQNADWIIHLDLPWTANAIEQRIGRLDRLGRDANHLDVHSVVVYSEQTIEEQLYRIWNEGLHLFDKSLSGLEIITGELNERIVEAIEEDMESGLEAALDDIMEMMEDTIDAVEEEQLYDSGRVIYRPINHAIEQMLKTYTSGENNLFEEAMLGWADHSGLRSTENDDGTVEFSEKNFSPMAAIQSLLIPPAWTEYDKTPVVRRLGRILGTFERDLSILREDLIFYAPGDPTFESIISNAIDSGRGRCCAVSGITAFDFHGFCFTYGVEPNINLMLEEQVPVQLLSQFRMFLPMEQIRILISIDGSEDIPEEEVLEYITDYDSMNDSTHLGRRGGSNPPLLQFMASYPKEDWRIIVLRAQKKAKEKAKAQVVNLTDLQSAKQEINRILHGYQSQLLYLGRDQSEIQRAKAQYTTVFKALQSPVLRLDSVCYLRLGR